MNGHMADKIGLVPAVRLTARFLMMCLRSGRATDVQATRG
jgi:hypothetical protein